ncbi:MAG: hypothetical protein ACRDZO_07310 [Egibacteraceae bacterium]
MSVRRTIRRRHVLLGAGGLATSALLGRLVGFWPLAKRGDDPLAERLTRLLTHADSARLIGQEYLKVTPAEAAPALLATLIAASLPSRLLRNLPRTTDAQLRELLWDGIRKDFAQEHVVTLDGWVLSRTEARLYGLTSLSRT